MLSNSIAIAAHGGPEIVAAIGIDLAFSVRQAVRAH
jgi:hypothetical protein